MRDKKKFLICMLAAFATLASQYTHSWAADDNITDAGTTAIQKNYSVPVTMTIENNSFVGGATVSIPDEFVLTKNDSTGNFECTGYVSAKGTIAYQKTLAISLEEMAPVNTADELLAARQLSENIEFTEYGLGSHKINATLTTNLASTSAFMCKRWTAMELEENNSSLVKYPITFTSTPEQFQVYPGTYKRTFNFKVSLESIQDEQITGNVYFGTFSSVGNERYTIVNSSNEFAGLSNEFKLAKDAGSDVTEISFYPYITNLFTDDAAIVNTLVKAETPVNNAGIKKILLRGDGLGNPSLGANAFEGYPDLEEIYFDTAIDSISADAFVNCPSGVRLTGGKLNDAKALMLTSGVTQVDFTNNVVK